MEEQTEQKVTFKMKETKEILDFMMAFGHGLEAVRADNKYDGADIIKMWPAIQAIIPAITDSEKVILEFQMADKESLTTLANHVRDNLTLGEKSTEEFIEESVYLLVNLFLFVKKYFFKEDEIIENKVEEEEQDGQNDQSQSIQDD